MSKRSIFVFMTLLLLSGILLMIWISGMQPTFSTPEEAFMDAFGPSGWLGLLEEFVLHEEIPTSEGVVVLYSGYKPKVKANQESFLLGIADAKPNWRGWYTHGRQSLLTPPLAKTELLSCAQALRLSSGERFFAVSGHVRPERVDAIEAIEAIEVTFSTDDGERAITERAIIRDNTFVAISHHATGLKKLVVIDQNGQVVEQLQPDACQQER